MTEKRDSVKTGTTEYVEKDGKHLRRGFTTGSCAAAAAAAAVQMLLTGEIVQEVEIRTPGGPVYRAQILKPEITIGTAEITTDVAESLESTAEITDGERPAMPVKASCAVRKDGGDDPDITTGTLIAAEVTRAEEPGIFIDGGKGIGRVTKPGLDRPVGEAAINTVPREMIRENVERVISVWQNNNSGAGETESTCLSGFHVLISAPEGESLAQRTFNPKLGIVGGISILGTTGIVEPMSDRAVVETIRAQLNVLKAQGHRTLVMAPGNYGLSFLTTKYGLREEEVVLISNYAAEAVEMAADSGFEGILLAGHIGKLVKIAGGVRNTHSMYGDRRMEILWEIAEGLRGTQDGKALSRDGASAMSRDDRNALQSELADCVMTDAALEVLEKYGLKEQAAQEMARRICGYLREWSGGRLQAETIVFSNKNLELVRSEGAEGMVKRV